MSGPWLSRRWMSAARVGSYLISLFAALEMSAASGFAYFVACWLVWLCALALHWKLVENGAVQDLIIRIEEGGKAVGFKVRKRAGRVDRIFDVHFEGGGK